ncbi:hypothetical protein AS200_04105 [Streptomyces sp. CdTB01]|nr:sigma factor [Streptomyces sp. CdTB01]ALV31325.1 hypothetical protein AS200_04105 [Streptomyces sp. CdTB01]
MRTRVRNGDPEAFAELFDACARAVYNHAFRLTADWSLAEDVMSTTFMEAWRRRASVEDDAVDATGRHGVAIAREDSGNGERTEWIFDKKTLRFLGERTVVVKAVAHSPFKVGTVTFTSAITQRAIVDASKQVPGQAS